MFGSELRVRLGGDRRDGDHVFEGPDGAKVFIDPRSFRFLDGTTLDYDTSLVSKGFIFNNPHAKKLLRLRDVVFGVIRSGASRPRWLAAPGPGLRLPAWPLDSTSPSGS